MSIPHSSPVPASLEQQRKLARELMRAAQDGDPAALARIRAVRDDAATASRPLLLADAQLAIAREGGFDSWPKLVADLQARDVATFATRSRRTTSGACSSSSRWRTCGPASTIRCSPSASGPRTSRRRPRRCCRRSSPPAQT